MRSLAMELGFRGLSSVVKLGTDSSAAKSFVCRRGLGTMRHLDIRDLAAGGGQRGNGGGLQDT